MKKLLKVLIYVMVLLALSSCAEKLSKEETKIIEKVRVEKHEALPQIEKDFIKNRYINLNERGFKIIVIDSCEYIQYYTYVGRGGAYGLTHKGNCKFCRERNKNKKHEKIN